MASPKSQNPAGPNDTSILRQVELNKTRAILSKKYTYTVCQLILGILFYTPHIQTFLSSDKPVFQTLTTFKLISLILGSLLALHALTNLLILFYNSLCLESFELNEGSLVGYKFSKLQAKLLGLSEQLTKNSSRDAAKTPTPKSSPVITDRLLREENLPKINQPLINENFRTPTKNAMLRPPQNLGKNLGSLSPQANLVKNASFLSAETTELLNSPKFKNMSFNLEVDTDSLLVNKNTSFSQICRNFDSCDDETENEDENDELGNSILEQSKHSISNLNSFNVSNSNLNDNSTSRRSFVDSFEQSFNSTSGKNNKNTSASDSMVAKIRLDKTACQTSKKL